MSLSSSHPDSTSDASSPLPGWMGATASDPHLAMVSRFPRPGLSQIHAAQVLIIDDEPEIAELIGTQLQEHGFNHVDILTDSESAVATIRDQRPDLVLLDVQMPNSGLEILRRLKQSTDLHAVPVILFTGDHSETLRLAALQAAADDFLTKPVEPAELVARARNAIAGKLLRDQMALHSQALEADMLRDGLTGAANRRAFDYELGRRFVDWQRLRAPLSLLMVDIDYFKSVNDRFGHLTGDRVLQETAEQIQHCVRDMDLVARYGGEEFGVLLPNTDVGEAVVTAERIRSAVASKTLAVGEEILAISVSVGVATSLQGDDSASLVRRADEALYESKRSGRNRVSLHNGTSLVVAPAGRGTWNKQSAPLSKPSTTAPPDLSWKAARIAVVSSNVYFRKSVTDLLAKEGYPHVTAMTAPFQLSGRTRREPVDLILLDIDPANPTVLNWLQKWHRANNNDATVIAVLPAHGELFSDRVLAAGAEETLSKPVRAPIWQRRIRNVLVARDQAQGQARFQDRVDREVRLKAASLETSRRELVHCLARLGEGSQDPDGQHVIRVGRYAALIGEGMGLEGERIAWLELAAQLHDLGQLGERLGGAVPGTSGEATAHHGEWGAAILGQPLLPAPVSGKRPSEETNGGKGQSPLLQMAARIARSHHERWDGTGEPDGLAGSAIPLEARIAAVADAFEKLTEGRISPGTEAFSACLRQLELGSGKQFDPAVIAAFHRRRAQIAELLLSYTNTTTITDQMMAPRSKKGNTD